MDSTPRRTSYTAGYKLKVIQFAEEKNNCAAAREFSINESVIRAWRKRKPELVAMPKSKKTLRFRKTPYEKMEDSLYSWICELRQNGLIVTRMAIRTKAMQLHKLPEFATTESFKASRGWCTRFMRRRGLVLRQRTHIAQKLPKDLDEKLTKFQHYVIDSRKRFAFPLEHIGNMEETPMFFDIPSNRTVHFSGQSTV